MPLNIEGPRNRFRTGDSLRNMVEGLRARKFPNLPDHLRASDSPSVDRTSILALRHPLSQLNPRWRKMAFPFGESYRDIENIPPQDRENVIGGKGVRLFETTKAGAKVAPGFIIPAYMCEETKQGSEMPHELKAAIAENVNMLENIRMRNFGGIANPLLVFVEPVTNTSMPGMPEKLLNVGLNDDIVKGLAEKWEDEHFALDVYRRFIQMYCNSVAGISEFKLGIQLEDMGYPHKFGIDGMERYLSIEDLKSLIKQLKTVYQNSTGEEFPQDPFIQLEKSINAMFRAWYGENPTRFRTTYNVPHTLGTAVYIGSMVFGNYGETSGTGIAFTRNPLTGERRFHSEYLSRSQGTDIVSGSYTSYLDTHKIVTGTLDPNTGKIEIDKGDLPSEPQIIDPVQKGLEAYKKSLQGLELNSQERNSLEIYLQITKHFELLERHFKNALDIEFIVENGTVFIEDVHFAKRLGKAAVKIATDLESEGTITDKDAVMIVKPEDLNIFFTPRFNEIQLAHTKPIGEGYAAAEGHAVGRVVFDVETLTRLKDTNPNEKYILVRFHDIFPEEVEALKKAEGILISMAPPIGWVHRDIFGTQITHRMGRPIEEYFSQFLGTQSGAVYARGFQIPAITRCNSLVINFDQKQMSFGNTVINELDTISIDGKAGNIYNGSLMLVQPPLPDDFKTFMSLVDRFQPIGSTVSIDDAYQLQDAKARLQAAQAVIRSLI